MKHIKKLLALCLTLALVLSLAACGKQEEQPPETTPASYRIAALRTPPAAPSRAATPMTSLSPAPPMR